MGSSLPSFVDGRITEFDQAIGKRLTLDARVMSSQEAPGGGYHVLEYRPTEALLEMAWPAHSLVNFDLFTQTCSRTSDIFLVLAFHSGACGDTRCSK